MDTINIGYQRIDQLIFEIKLNENYILIGEDILQDENLVNKFLKWMFWKLDLVHFKFSTSIMIYNDLL